MRRLKHILLSLVVLGAPLAAEAEMALPGLKEPVTVTRDANGIPHIRAKNQLDAFFMQGWVHAEDRLFQMDVSRRAASGKLAELFGPGQLAADFVARTIGLGRAGERSLAAHSEDMLAALEAYSQGVNAFIDRAEKAGQLPPEYGALELTEVDAWTPLDSVLVGKGVGFLTSMLVTRDIELSLAIGAYQVTGEALGFDGTALFFEDLYRSAPFDPASTVPDAEHFGNGADDGSESAAKTSDDRRRIGPKALALARKFLTQLSALPRVPGVPPADGKGMGGSNTWVISGTHTRSGDPILANDMHLGLESPTIFHQIHLSAPGLDVIGSGVAGAPCVARGHNRHLAWGITNSRLDITDIYKEEVVPVPMDVSPSGLATVYQGEFEPIIPVPQQYTVNLPGNGVPDDVFLAKLILEPDELEKISLVLVVPRRNNGALITAPEVDPISGVPTALSVQSVAFSATRDLEGLCGFNRARNLDEFTAALQLIDFASQNISYADTKGNIAYFVTGEVPLREDLQYPAADRPIVPPFFIRDGTGGHEWIRIYGDLPENQATAYEILPFEEMPQTVNPPSGIIVNANNDQAGNTLDNNPLNQQRPDGGIYYLNWGGHNFSIRAGRITSMIREQLDQDEEENGDHWAWRVSKADDDNGDEGYEGKFSFRDTKVMQADTVLGDAEVFVPFIVDAFDNASDTDASPALVALASDPGVREAVDRFRGWDFTTPTGIFEGYDADPNSRDLDASVSASIYSVWRGRMVANSIDAVLDAISIKKVLDTLGLTVMPRPREREEVVTALKHLVENDGVSESGLNFFVVPDVEDPAVRRDIVVLTALREALDQLASDEFAPAFGNSSTQDDYRWGKLHRIVFEHVLGSVAGEFNVPPAFWQFPPPLEGLAGIPTDGGFETVDVASPGPNNVRVTDSDSFMFNHGPTGRFVSKLGRHRPLAVSSLPGGESAIPSSPFYLNLLEPWLLNETHRLLMSPWAIRSDAVSMQTFVPRAP